MTSTRTEMPGCISQLIIALALAGGVFVAFIYHGMVFGASMSPGPEAWWLALMGGLVAGPVALAAIAVLAWLWPAARYRAVTLTALLMGLPWLLLLPVHLLPLESAQSRMLLQSLLLGAYGAALLRYRALLLDKFGLSAGPNAAPGLLDAAYIPAVAYNPATPHDPSAAANVPPPVAVYDSSPAAEALFQAAANPGRYTDDDLIRAGALPAQVTPSSLDQPWLRWLTAAGLGLALLDTWVRVGALGSPLDTLLAALLAALLGLLAALVSEVYLFAPLRRTSASRASDFWLGGLGLNVALALLMAGSAFAYSSIQLALMLALPALGWSLAGLNMLFPGPAALHDPQHPWGQRALWGRILPAALLIGLALFGPLAWFDPDEAVGMLGGAGEVSGWLFQAALRSAIFSLGAGVLFLLIGVITRRQLAVLTTTAGRASCALALLGGVLMAGACSRILTAGQVVSGSQPVFNGERLFVILDSQADLSHTAAIADPLERRAAVYQALTAHANTTQAPLRQTLDSLGIAYTPYYLVNALEVQADPVLRAYLALRSDVDRVLDSPHLRPLPAVPPTKSGMLTPPPANPQWNLTSIRADLVWQELGVQGEGILIGQADSGVDVRHPEFAPGAYRGDGRGPDESAPGESGSDYNWLDAWYNQPEAYDISSHGTHTLGSIVGQNVGVAPQARFIACANLVRNLGNPALYLDCWQFLLAPYPTGGDALADGRPELGAQVLNNSWGCPPIEGCDANTFATATQALKAAGVFVVVSAGNDGPACGSLQSPPAVYAEVFSVGAVDAEGQLAEFSNIGPAPAETNGGVKPDLLAPGQGVLSATPNRTYATYSGTSMAGPHVVGVVALMWSANPALIGQIDATAAILRDTARPYNGSLPDCPGVNERPSTAAGYGLLDAYAAVQAALAWQP